MKLVQFSKYHLHNAHALGPNMGVRHIIFLQWNLHILKFGKHNNYRNFYYWYNSSSMPTMSSLLTTTNYLELELRATGWSRAEYNRSYTEQNQVFFSIFHEWTCIFQFPKYFLGKYKRKYAIRECLLSFLTGCSNNFNSFITSIHFYCFLQWHQYWPKI